MDLIEIQKKIVPEITYLMEKRYDILKYVYFNQPIGRRTLSSQLGISERTVRTEVNTLKDSGLLNIETMGMYITEEGKEVIRSLEDTMTKIKGLSNLEMELSSLLGIKEVIILPSDSNENELVIKDMGKRAASYLRDCIETNMIIGITGGTTMASVADEMPSRIVKENITITPARGGLGKNLELQSNSIAAKLASKIGARYKLLHVPDNLDEESLKTVLKIPVIKDVIDTIDNMDILVLGIGRADKMAERRSLSCEKIKSLSEQGAVSEAFGHYFDIDGKEIWESPTVGLSIDSFKKIPLVIAVAGGKEKAEAIKSVMTLRNDTILITDEGAAKEIIRLVD